MQHKQFLTSLKTNIINKRIFILSGLFLCFSQGMNADDDVYDAPRQREVKVKQTQKYTAPAEVEKSVPYNEEGSTTSRQQSTDYNNDNNYNNDDNNSNYQADNYSGDDWNDTYSDRIRRFHNPSIRYSVGWSSCNNAFYDPWNSYNSFGSYSYTPSWAYSYNNFYNPFWGSPQVIIINDPWMNNWYSGYYNPYNNWYSPTCSAIIYNNYPYYGGYYEGSRRNVVNAPRTGGYNNTPYYRSQGNNYNNTNNTGSGYNKNNQPSQSKRWNSNTNNNGNSGQENNVYKYNKPNSNQGNWNNSNSSPARNDWGKGNDNSDKGGVKIGTRPK